MLNKMVLRNLYSKYEKTFPEWGNVFFVAAIIFLLLSIGNIVIQELSINSFRHDELRYIDGYSFKLSNEGRWVNYLLFDWLKTLDFKLAILVNLCCFAIFSWVCSCKFLDKRYALLCTIVLLLIPPIHLLNEWPQTILTSFVILLLATIVHDKVPLLLFFSVFGILSNGALSHFYFLLPLLFLRSKHSFLTLVLYWILGFLIGYCFSQFITWLLLGKFFTLPSWKKPNYIRSFSDLILNIENAWWYFKFNLKFIGWLSGCIFLLSIPYFLYENKHNLSVSLRNVFLSLLVICSIFALSIPVGISTATRSLVCSFSAFVIIVFMSLSKRKNLLVVVGIIFASNFYLQNYYNLNYLNTINNVWHSGLQTLNIVPQQFKGIVMLSTTKDFKQHVRKLEQSNHLRRINTEGLGQPRRWVPVAYDFGFTNVIHGELDKNYLRKIGLDSIIHNVEFLQNNAVYEYAFVEDFLVVKLKL